MHPNRRPFFRSLLILVTFMAVLTSTLSGCSNTKDHDDIRMAPMEELPSEMREAPAAVRESYRFAVANPDVLKEIPCYCGCGAMGHTSNYACYVSGEDSDGTAVFDTHALGCSICVDITQDTMRLMRQGKTTSEIRSYVDQTYSQYGPSNIP